VIFLITIGILSVALNIQPVNANPGCIIVKVQYANGCPRPDALVKIGDTLPMGTTGPDGIVTRCDLNLSKKTYQAKAFWPNAGTQFGYPTPLPVDENGDGSATIIDESILDIDSDGIGDCHDNCPDDYNPNQLDNDEDGIGDICDNCPNDYNPDQTNSDGDSFGAACDCDDSDSDRFPGNPEICDGIDNDCDGDIDEDLTQPCGSGNCEGFQICTAGFWGDCSKRDTDCGICCLCEDNNDPAETYDETQDADCDNGLYCDGEETCQALFTCQAGTPVDCSYLNDQCNLGVCDKPKDTCVKDPTPYEGLSCNDGLFCTDPDTCTSGVCGGPARDCSANDINEIATCTNNPDNNPFTWDYFAGFTSVCDEFANVCTAGDETITHTCSVDQCGAECDSNDDCVSGICQTDCTCLPVTTTIPEECICSRWWNTFICCEEGNHWFEWGKDLNTWHMRRCYPRGCDVELECKPSWANFCFRPRYWKVEISSLKPN